MWWLDDCFLSIVLLAFEGLMRKRNREKGKTEGKGDAGEADAWTGQLGATDTTEDENKCADQLREVLPHTIQLSWVVTLRLFLTGFISWREQCCPLYRCTAGTDEEERVEIRRDFKQGEVVRLPEADPGVQQGMLCFFAN